MIIVGNGSSILDKELGSKIDSFESIVRFNNYRTKDFELFTGEKTTHWWNTVDIKNSLHPLFQKSYREVCLHSWDFNPETDQLWARQKQLIRAKKTFKSQEQWVFELQEFGGTKYYAFSTGLLAIWYYLKTREKLTITGFDWWEGREKHHPWDNQPIGPIHQPQEEKKILDKLFHMERLEWLI